MTAPLSADLRARLVRAVEGGSSARAAARRFEVSPSAAIKLMRRVRATGSAAPAKVGGYRRPLLAGHEDLLRQLTARRPSRASPWPSCGPPWRDAASWSAR
jgi:transposase